jgi:hypothetical protein
MKHLESRLQQNCIKWFRYCYPQYDKVMFAVPNGGARTAREAAIFKHEGVVPGVSDLVLLVAKNDFNALLIELKIGMNKQSKKQKEFQKQAEKYKNKYVLVYSFDEFMKEVENYLN